MGALFRMAMLPEVRAVERRLKRSLRPDEAPDSPLSMSTVSVTGGKWCTSSAWCWCVTLPGR